MEPNRAPEDRAEARDTPAAPAAAPSPCATPTGLACEEVSREFDGRPALLPISFSVAEGEHLVVRGPNGSGKTTLLRVLAGLLEPTRGRVLDGGEVVARPGWVLPPHRRGIGMLFQGLALWPHMTVAEQVEFSLRGGATSREARRLAVARKLEEVGISHLAGRLPRELSGGERQRVAWARAVAGEPRLLFLDEPLTSLDPALREELLDAVVRYAGVPGRTVILVTHDADVARRFGGRVLDLGRRDAAC